MDVLIVMDTVYPLYIDSTKSLEKLYFVLPTDLNYLFTKEILDKNVCLSQGKTALEPDVTQGRVMGEG